MKPYSFRLPDIGEGTTEAEIVKWHVAVGDTIEEDALLVDVMTDKATVELSSPVTGRVLSVNGDTGKMIPIGSLLVEIELANSGDKPTNDNLSNPVAVVDAAKTVPTVAIKSTSASSSSRAPAEPTSRTSILASPVTRRKAFERGIPLQFVKGTGPAGRVLAEDLDNHASERETPQKIERTGIAEEKMTGLRRRIAEKMEESSRQIPHFSFIEELDLTELEGLRAEINAERTIAEPKLTLLSFFMRGIVKLVPEFPRINALYDSAAKILRVHEGVHIGIATQTDAGLVVPVVRHAEARDLWDSARELRRVTTAARDGSATRAELSGSTITLTSLGALGGIAATPLINHPEVAIIGPNKLVERPVVMAGRIVVRKMMNLSSSFDHRIIDGHDAARFVQRFKRLIERPGLLLLERER